MYCNKKTYSYRPQGELGSSSEELVVVYHRAFTVSGVETEAVTYLFDLTIGFEFAFAA